MDLLYFATPEGNFGDDLNAWLWDALLPGWREWPAPGVLVGAGTVLKQGFLPAGPKLVLGSGVGYGTPPDLDATGPWDIRAVRGPRTAAALGLPPETAIIDPAAMIPLLPDFRDLAHDADAGRLGAGEMLFVPHYKSAPLYDWPAICAKVGVAYQSPSEDSRTVIRRIAGARAVIAESMHAAIIADAFGVPWRGVSILASFNRFKWVDWAESVGLDAPPIAEFFAPMRHGQRALRRLRGGGRTTSAPTSGPTSGPTFGPTSGPTPVSTVGPTGTPPAAPTPRSAAQTPLAPLLGAWAARDLAAEMTRTFVLSDRARLEAARERFATVLAQVAADYDSSRPPAGHSPVDSLVGGR